MPPAAGVGAVATAADRVAMAIAVAEIAVVVVIAVAATATAAIRAGCQGAAFTRRVVYAARFLIADRANCQEPAV